MKAIARDSNVRRLLMVDDDDAFRLVMKETISKSGMYDVHSVDSGEAALEAFNRDHFDVVILDYRMPGISGLAVLQWMHEQKINTPVVMMTAAGTESVAVEAMKLGAYDYVRKEQIDVDHIRILIDGVVERHLFRVEKEAREAADREREKTLAAIEMFHSTLASIAQVVNHSLSMLSLSIRQHEVTLKPYVADEGLRRLSQVFGDINREHVVISSALKSMLDMANVVHGNFTAENYNEQMQKRIETNLENAKEFGGASSLHERPGGT